VLRLVHRRVGVDEQLGADRLTRTGVGDPDAGGDRQRQAGRLERRQELLLDAGGERLGITGVVQVLAQDDELVAGDTGQRVAGRTTAWSR
jgi:hypothetical protein